MTIRTDPPVESIEDATPKDSPQRILLGRELGLAGAVALGLSSIIGTGLFVSLGLAAKITGPSVVLAIVLACLTATCNALNSAQLARAHPTSGGTYEYGCIYINKYFGFVAGWTFLCAKCASGASAAIGFASYMISNFDERLAKEYRVVTPIAVALLAITTTVTILGIKRTNIKNFILLAVTLSVIVFFIFAGIPAFDAQNFKPFFKSYDETKVDRNPVYNFLEATALMFVAFTGYGRVATLGEEVKNPRKTIPIAIMVTLTISAVIYVTVSVIAVGSSGIQSIEVSNFGAPLISAVQGWTYVPRAWHVMTVGASSAMVGVLLNLLLGLSRMVVAMARRKDIPVIFDQIRLVRGAPSPVWAILLISFIVFVLILIGSVKATWSFSAFTVLIYYSICNLAALRMPDDQRMFSKAFAVGGLIACLVLAFFVDWIIWVIGIAVIIVGLIFQFCVNRWYERKYAFLNSKIDSAKNLVLDTDPSYVVASNTVNVEGNSELSIPIKT